MDRFLWFLLRCRGNDGHKLKNQNQGESASLDGVNSETSSTANNYLHGVRPFRETVSSVDTGEFLSTVFTTGSHWYTSRATSYHPIFWRSIYVLVFLVVFLSAFATSNVYTFPFSHSCCMPCLSHPLHLTIPVILDEKYKWQSSSTWRCLNMRAALYVPCTRLLIWWLLLLLFGSLIRFEDRGNAFFRNVSEHLPGHNPQGSNSPSITSFNI